MPPKRKVKKRGGKKAKGANASAAAAAAGAAAGAGVPAEERQARAEAAKSRGNELFVEGDALGALTAFSEAVALDPANHVYYSNRSAAHLTLGDAQEALADARKCVELAPEWSKGYGRLGAAYQSQGEFAKAVRAYTDGLAHDANNGQLQQGLAQSQASMQAADESKADESVDEATRRAEIEENIRRARADRAQLESGVATCVGIDLGTTYSCVGVWRDGGVEIIANSEGNRTTPSWVSFAASGERLIGEAAKTAAAGNAANTVYDAKRIIGQRFADAQVQADVARFPFRVVSGEDDKPVIEVEHQGETRSFAPEEISAMVLARMRDTAEAFLGTEVRSAVVTVPAYFSDAQRQATKNAGTIAGLEVKRIINEPTAAALAYGLDASGEAAAAAAGEGNATHVLIFDLGGGTFDVSLLSITGGIFEVLATGGDTHLGGEDFDNNLVDFCVADFQRKHRGMELRSSARSMRRLRAACESAKRMLSTSSTATVEVDTLFEGEDYQVVISRAKFESLNQAAFDRTLATVRAVLTDAKMGVDAVSDVVLVGGSTRIPKIQAMLSELFNGKELCRSINPDEAVAYGAAVQGAILSGVRSAATNSVLLVDVTPLSLGIELTGRVMSTLIKRNTAIPVRKTKTYTTEEDWQTSVDICVYEGERASVDANNKLGEFRIGGIQRARRGVPQIEVTFDIDANGIMTVSAKDTESGAEAQTTISNSGGRLSQADIDRMVAEAAEFKAADSELLRRVEARNELEHVLYSVLEVARDTEDTAAEAECLEVRDWLADNEEASISEYNTKRRQVERLCRPGGGNEQGGGRRRGGRR